MRNLIMMLALALLSTPIYAQQETSKVKLLDPAVMDVTLKPGDDFMNYAGGIWLRKNPVPPKQVRWGSFIMLREFNAKAIRDILADASTDGNAMPGSAKKVIGDFYAAAMDSMAIEKAGFSPVKPDYDRAGSVKSISDIMDQIVYQRINGMGNPLFGFFVGQDRKNPNSVVAQLVHGGTTLPDRDFYLKDDVRSKRIQAAFDTYLITLFKLAGENELVAQQKAISVFRIEKQLAKSQLSRVEMRDPYKTYNKLLLVDFIKKTPTFDWANTLVKFKVPSPDSILVSSPRFFASADSLLLNVPVEDWRNYLQWNIIRNAAPFLSKDFTDATFIYNQAISGQKIQTPRWQRMSALVDNSIGELLGQLYVEKHFKSEAKVRMDEMIKNLIKAFEIRITNLDWMSEITKQRALDKLHALTPKIGYPEKWRDYKGLEISRYSFYQNVKNSGKWAYEDMISGLGKPVDRKRFNLTVPSVNASYHPVYNDITFPAGLLQYPFFNPEADDAFNYGAIGAIIGHEISHGFDDSGSQYDKDGALRNWWTTEDRARFMDRAKKLQEQFDAYTVLDSLHVNGKLTLGENIGDLGGLNAAYEAFKMTKQGKGNKKIDGFTPDQRFFLSWAQVWRSNTLPDTKAQLLITDPHSPHEYRTIGAPVNMDAWYKAFNIMPGDKLYKKPEDRIKIW